MQRATLKEVAQRAGVHPGTASRALNAETVDLVKPDTAARIQEAARDLGYVANPIARSLKTSRSASIGLVIPDLTNPLFPPIARGMEDVLRTVGYSVWIVNTDNREDLAKTAVESLRRRSVEGFVFATAHLEDPLLEDLSHSAIPIVLINRRLASGTILSVTSDDAAGVAMAIELLVEHGHRNIGHLAGPQDLSTGVARRRAFSASLEDHGLTALPQHIVACTAWTEEAGAVGMRELLDADPSITAVFAGNDLLALGAYDALTERGLRCPDDVSVVGFDDLPFMDKVHPPMSTVRIPHYEMGAEAARLLLSLIDDESRHPRSVLMTPTLVPRKSVSVPRGSE